MRKIEIKSWKKTINEQEVEEDFTMVLKALLNTQKPEVSRGIDRFRLFGRLAKAFEKAEKTKFIELEEGDYSYLKGLIEKELPAKWAMQKEVLENVEIYIEAKPEEKK